MSRDVLLSLLAKGSNGEQILQILDSITDGVSDSGDSDSAANPTLSEIQFWYLTALCPVPVTPLAQGFRLGALMPLY